VTDAITPEEMRTLLYECTLVLQPGETLIVQVPDTWLPGQVRNYQDYLDKLLAVKAPHVKVLVVAATQLGVAPGNPLADRVRSLALAPAARRG
jgi:hypothetical protein